LDIQTRSLPPAALAFSRSLRVPARDKRLKDAQAAVFFTMFNANQEI